VRSVGPDVAPVGEYELDGGHAVGLQAVAAREPADAAAERVAGDADVGGGAVQPGQPVLGQEGRDALPLDARADADALRALVDRDVLQVADVDEQRVVQRAVRADVVAGRLRRDPQAVIAGVPDGGDDLAHVARIRHGGGAQVDGGVEREGGVGGDREHAQTVARASIGRIGEIPSSGGTEAMRMHRRPRRCRKTC
jgi:hypothetical protein